MNTASVKKPMPSMAKATPNTAPHCDIHAGHRIPNSKLKMVPETAPTANRTPTALDQRRAMTSYTGSPVRMKRHSAMSNSMGSPMPRHENTMWKPSEMAICSRRKNRSVAASTTPPSVGAPHSAAGPSGW